MLKINQIDLKKTYSSPYEEIKATKSYIYQLVEELRYRLGDEPKEEPEEEQTNEEIIGEAVRASYKYIDAIGIDADWIKTGTIQDRSGNFYLDLETGTLRANALALRLTDRGNTTIYDYIDSVKSEIEAQIDKSISSWFYPYEPSLSNQPALSWVQADAQSGTDTEKNAHIGDVFYDTNTGYSYKFIYDNPQYKWVKIVDSDVTRALAAAAHAQETADGKMTIFYGAPTDTFTGMEQGDYLVNSADGCTYRWDGSSWVKETDYSTPISGLRTDLNVQAGLISSKVSYTDYNGIEIASLINQSPSSVSIAAEHIQLTGRNIADRLNASGTEVVIDSEHLDISSKADLTALNALGSRLTTAETRITANATAIESRATITDLDAVNSRVTQAETRITQNATAIESRATKTEVNTLKGTVESHTSQIAQNANAITLRVKSRDYTGNKIASLINQDATTVKIAASKINLDGYVTISDLGAAGTTTINGDNITTGTISGASMKLGGSSTNKYGRLDVFNANDKRELALDYNGLKNYRDGKYISKFGNNLYTDKTWAAIDLASNAAGFEISDASQSIPLYRFSRTGAQFMLMSSGVVRTVVHTTGLRTYSAAGILRGDYMANGWTVYNGDGVIRTNAGLGVFRVYDSNGNLRAQLDSGGLGFWNANGVNTATYPSVQ